MFEQWLSCHGLHFTFKSVFPSPLKCTFCYNARGVDVVESAAAFKCDEFEFESWQARYLTNAVYTGGAQYMNVRRSVHWWHIFCI